MSQQPDKGELPEAEWGKEIQTGYEKLIAIIHEAHDNGLIFGRLYKKFGDTFNEIVRSHLNSRELPPAIGVSQWKKMGLELGYWAYFEKEVKADAIDEVIRIIEKEIGIGHSIETGATLSDVICKLKK